MTKAISIPLAGLDDANAVEVARVWVAHQGLHCTLNVGIYRDSGVREAKAWGVILADMARHLSHALRDNGMESSGEEALRAIRAAMIQELDDPTSKAEGAFGSPVQ